MQGLKYPWISDNSIFENKVITLPQILRWQLPTDTVLYPSRADTSEDAANFTHCRNIKIFRVHVWLLPLIQQCVEQFFELVIYFYLILWVIFWHLNSVTSWTFTTICIKIWHATFWKPILSQKHSMSNFITSLDKAHKVNEFRCGKLPLSTYRIGSFLYCEKHLFAPFLLWGLTFNNFFRTAFGTSLWNTNT